MTPTRCSATQLCLRPDWRIQYEACCGPECCGNQHRMVFCYTCGGSWTEEITHSQAVRDGEEPPFSAAPDVADDATLDGWVA